MVRSHNMVFTQGRGFVVGALFGLQRPFAPLPRRGHRLFGNVGFFLVAPLSRVGLPRRGHRLFGSVVWRFFLLN